MRCSLPRSAGAARRVAPAVLGLIAEHTSCFLNREESLVWTELLLQRHLREELRQQLRGGTCHYGVSVRDHKDFRALERGFERSSDRLGGVLRRTAAPAGCWLYLGTNCLARRSTASVVKTRLGQDDAEFFMRALLHNALVTPDGSYHYQR